jgi:nitrate reductase NapE
MTGSGENGAGTADRRRWRTELLAFLVLAFGVWPFVAVAVVGAYGFAVWMLQLLFGPPGPPTALH